RFCVSRVAARHCSLALSPGALLRASSNKSDQIHSFTAICNQEFSMTCSRILRGRNRFAALMTALLLILAMPLTLAMPARADTAIAPQRALNEQAQDIKKQALELNRDLFNLEEELLFPANTQVAVFVSLDTGEFFKLDAVQIKLDDKVVANYLYTENQIDALHRGGIQRLYVGNVRAGRHELGAVVTGRGA